MNTALLLIDIQNDYFPGGAMTLAGGVQAGERAGAALRHFRARCLPIVHVQHLSTRPEAGFFLPDTAGVIFHETVTPLSGETVIQKHYPNSFRETALLDHLKAERISRLVVGGMMTQMCVDATVRAAFDYGFACTVLHDACTASPLSFGGRDIPADQVHGAFLAALGFVYARIISTEEAIRKLS